MDIIYNVVTAGCVVSRKSTRASGLILSTSNKSFRGTEISAARKDGLRQEESAVEKKSERLPNCGLFTLCGASDGDEVTGSFTAESRWKRGLSKHEGTN